MLAPTTFSLHAGVFAQAGVPAYERICELAGIAPSAALRVDEFFRLWAAAEQLLPERTAGLRLGAQSIDGGYGVGAIVALHAPHLRAAVVALARYKHLTCPEIVELDVQGNDAIVRWRWLQAEGPAPRLLVDTTTASLAALALRGTGGAVRPLRLELARRATDVALLQQHFGCPVAFGATYDALVFARDSLEVPFVTADGGAFARIVSGLEERLRLGDGYATLVGDVRIAIARQLSEGRPASLAAVAHRLATSARTLQRRLSENDTAFHEQLTQVRRTTSMRLLANTALDPVAIAMLLGFREPNSFTRAFRNWAQVTPLRWREERHGDDVRVQNLSSFKEQV